MFHAFQILNGETVFMILTSHVLLFLILYVYKAQKRRNIGCVVCLLRISIYRFAPVEKECHPYKDQIKPYLSPQIMRDRVTLICSRFRTESRSKFSRIYPLVAHECRSEIARRLVPLSGAQNGGFLTFPPRAEPKTNIII